jgi:hypothetical protein
MMDLKVLSTVFAQHLQYAAGLGFIAIGVWTVFKA